MKIRAMEPLIAGKTRGGSHHTTPGQTAVLEQTLSAELAAHLSYERPDRVHHNTANSRNGRPPEARQRHAV
jgi:transposase-like protein